MNYEQILIEEKGSIIGMLLNRDADIETAKDIYQDLFIKVKITLETGKYFEQGKFKGWLKFVARNMYMDILRKKYRSKEMPILYLKDERGNDISITNYSPVLERNIEEQIIYDELLTEVWEAKKRIPANQQEVIDLRLTKGLSYKEISKKLNIGENTALGRFRYAKINIKKIMRGN